MKDARSTQRESRKKSLRDSLRVKRSNIPITLQQTASISLAARCESILEAGAYAHVAGYFSIGGEIAVDQILDNVRSRNGISYAPILCAGSTLRFAPFDAATPMINNQFNIKEPDVDSSLYCIPADLDAVLVPLVGFDEGRNRMGMGGGFYDRSFSHRREQSDRRQSDCGDHEQKGKPLLIGVAYDLQQADSVFPDWWDVKLDVIVTESRVIE